MPPVLPTHGSIIDIGGGKVDAYILERLQSTLLNAKKRGDTPYLPDELLYYKTGLHIWSEIIYRPEYYQTRDEIALFEQNGEQIASHVQPGATLIDLGAGDTRKVEHLLTILERRRQPNVYLALDISRTSLEHNMSLLSKKHSHILCLGLWGTFFDALDWCAQISSPRIILSLGSVLFNDSWDTALATLKSWAAVMRDDDLILAGMDGHGVPKDYNKIWDSYHSDDKLFDRFWRNGFRVANNLTGEEWFRPEDWSVHSVIETDPVCHRFTFRAERDVALGSSGVVFWKGEEMEWFDAHKYNEKDVRTLCSMAGLEVLRAWKAKNSEMRQYLVRRRTGGQVDGQLPK